MNILVNMLLFIFGLFVIFGYLSLIPYALVNSFKDAREPLIWNPIKVWSEFIKVCLEKQDE